jgi:hypothetical protein
MPQSADAGSGSDETKRLTTHALSPSETPTSVRLLRNIDLVVLALALVLFLAAGFPLLGWVTGAGAWLLQRGVSELAVRRAERSDDPRTKVGLLAGSIVARGWIVALIIVGMGLATKRTVGLSSAVLFLATFTLQFTMTMAMRPFDKDARR